MHVKTYNKLIRNRIPEIIAANGKTCRTRQADGAEYRGLLEKKCMEEWQEYLESGSLEEMADLMEVIEAICKARGFDPAALQAVKQEKAAKRGAFEKRIFLHAVAEPDELLDR